MKWTYAWLNRPENANFTFEEHLEFDESLIKTKASSLLDLNEVKVTGNGHYSPSTEHLTLRLDILGEMIVPCALTLEPVPYPFRIETEEVLSFNPEEKDDGFWIIQNKVVDLTEIVWQLICLEIPLKVIKEGASIKKSGEGWRLISEEEQASEKENEIDPRLAKLKDYFKK
ncbi:TPA: DUF177 domain-containing protein [bacterium]|nr:DUF177 domain-containing protein [bacterium]